MSFRFSLIFRYFKVFNCPKSSLMVCLICNYLRSVRYLLFVLREYILKVHVLVSSEHKLYDIWNTCIMPCIYWSITYWNKLLITNLIKFTIKSFTMYINNIYIIMWSCLIHNMRISMTFVLTVLFHCVLHTCMRCMVKLEMCRETNQ